MPPRSPAKPPKPTPKAPTNKATKPKPPTAAAKAAHAAGHPTWSDMIKECIAAHPADARTGVSRPTIKKFVESKYHIALTAAAASQLNRAITSGAEKGVFSLPKGPSGKVKLASKATKSAAASAAKENHKPPASKVTPRATQTTKTYGRAKATPANSPLMGVARPRTNDPAAMRRYHAAVKAQEARRAAFLGHIPGTKEHKAAQKKPAAAKKEKATTTKAKPLAVKKAATNTKPAAAKKTAVGKKALPAKKAVAAKKPAAVKKKTTTVKKGAAKQVVVGKAAAKPKAKAASKAKVASKAKPASRARAKVESVEL